MSANSKTHSSYYSGLNDEIKERYDEKIQLIGDVDPYCRMEAKGKSTAVDVLEWMDWPDVMHADIYCYLILMPGMTHEQLKSYKSLEGYNHFVNGWVSGVTVVIVPHSRPRVYLFTATVRHSQHHH